MVASVEVAAIAQPKSKKIKKEKDKRGMAGKKKQVALRITPKMQEALEKWAADDFRSLNGQIEWILYTALQEAGRAPRSTEQEGDEKSGD